MKSPIIARKLTALVKTLKSAADATFEQKSKDGGFVAKVEKIPGPGTSLYRLTVAFDGGVFTYKRQLPDSKVLISQAKKWVKSYESGASIILTDFRRTASTKTASDSDPDWDTIVQRAADACMAFGYADACEQASDHNSEYQILSDVPWGAGAEITNYVPTTPDDLVAYCEKLMTAAWGKDAVLADAKSFMTETGETETTYGWYLATENMGHGVGLFDYGYDTTLTKSHVFEHLDAFVQVEDGKVMFYPADRGVKAIDVTDELGDLVLDETEGEEDVDADDEDERDASTKIASGAYTMVLAGDEGDGETVDLVNVAADQVMETVVGAGLMAYNQQHGSKHITYTGDYGDVSTASWQTAKPTGKEDTTPKHPLEAWCVAQLCSDKGGNTFSPAEVWVAMNMRSGITSAKQATKFVKDAQSSGGLDGLSINEGAGDADHFHEYVGDAYGYLMDEGVLSDEFSPEEVEAMDDAAKGRALLEHFFHDSTWYTDGYSMIEARPF